MVAGAALSSYCRRGKSFWHLGACQAPPDVVGPASGESVAERIHLESTRVLSDGAAGALLTE